MQVRVEDIAAKCFSCGGIEFERIRGMPSNHPDAGYACANCRFETTYGELLLQIANEAMNRAKAAVRARKWRKRGPGESSPGAGSGHRAP